ncbi:MAG TPA: hypothetical protein VGP68_11665 [Gemmataceae bacterium]|nr:hypothetical protein [Gemmataceae bacterium]
MVRVALPSAPRSACTLAIDEYCNGIVHRQGDTAGLTFWKGYLDVGGRLDTKGSLKRSSDLYFGNS